MKKNKVDLSELVKEKRMISSNKVQDKKPGGQFKSAHNIGDTVMVSYGEVSTTPDFLGQIVKVSFTRNKVLYDVLADQDLKVYQNIDSINVK